MKPLIYIFIPVHNEQATVGVMLFRLIQVMREIDMEYEVHLVLDGCTDESAEVVEPYVKKLPLTVTLHEKRLGYGKCLLEAIRKISAASQNPKRDFFVVLDADFSIDPVELKEMAGGIERNTVLYLPDRMSMPKNKVGLAKRLANRLAKKILRRRGAEFPAGIDLLSTVRACRVHHLRRNMPRLDVLNMLDANTPPAVAGALLYLALQDNSKKTEVLEIRGQNMRRGASRFSVLGTLRRLMFGAAVPRAIADFEGSRDDSGDRRPDRPAAQRSDSGQAAERSQGGDRSGSRRSRGGRGRRGRRPGSGGGGEQSRQPVQQLSRQPQAGSRPQEQGGRKPRPQVESKPQVQPGPVGGEGGSQAQPGGEQRQGSRKSRRRRRRPNKPRTDSSNTPKDSSQNS